MSKITRTLRHRLEDFCLRMWMRHPGHWLSYLRVVRHATRHINPEANIRIYSPYRGCWCLKVWWTYAQPAHFIRRSIGGRPLEPVESYGYDRPEPLTRRYTQCPPGAYRLDLDGNRIPLS